MTEEQIKQNAESFADNFCSREDQTGMWEECVNIYTAGAHSRDAEVNKKPNIYDLFDALDPNQKAVFVHANLAWARNIDLLNELEKRILWKDKA